MNWYKKTKFKKIAQTKYEYIGNCKDTVDILGIWDATEMAQMIDENNEDVKPWNIKEIIPFVPSQQKIQILQNPSNFECEKNISENIVWIYDINKDIHYFYRNI